MADNLNSRSWNGAPSSPQTSYKGGYDVKTSSMQATDAGANCYLVDESDNTHILLHVVEVTTNFALNGSTGQSNLKRDFYPRNFQQVSWSFTCQAPSQRHMGRIAEFIHKSQRNCVRGDSLMGLVFPRGGLRRTAATPNHDGMKGTHMGLSMAGYIQGIDRVHERFEPAPTYSFDFVVSRMRSGPFTDKPYVAYTLVKWNDLVQLITDGNLVKPPKTQKELDEEEAQGQIREAAQGVQEIIHVGADILESLLGG